VRPRFVAACIALAVLLHEAHELAHTAAGRVLCGGWGARDFNTWSLPAGCGTSVPTIAGPLFSFGVMWAGLLLVRRAPDRWPLGVALMLMANPFARLFTAAMGGGDEGVLVRHWFGLERGPLATAIAFGIVAALSGPPLVAAWRALPRPRRLPSYVGLLVAPMLVTGLLLFLLGNRLLSAGVLAQPSVLGAPPLVWLVTLAAAIALVALWGELGRTVTERPRAARR
jgi:hypothetical protein